MIGRGMMVLAAGAILAGGSAAQPAAIQGSANFTGHIALPRDGVLAVELLDLTQGGVPAERLAVARIPLQWQRQRPIPFTLPYDPTRLLPDHHYGLRGTIEIEGRVAFRTARPHPVLTEGAGENLALRLVRSGRGTGSLPPGSVPALIGPSWDPQDINGDAVLDRDRAGISFRANGRMGGGAGCNGFFGNYRLTDKTIRIDPLGQTAMACPGDLMDQEACFSEALRAAQQWRITPEGLLELLAGSGTPLLRFTRR